MNIMIKKRKIRKKTYNNKKNYLKVVALVFIE